MNKEKYIGGWILTNCITCAIVDVVFDINDKLKIQWFIDGEKYGKKSTCTIKYDKNGNDYILSRNNKLYLSESIRIEED